MLNIWQLEKFTPMVPIVRYKMRNSEERLVSQGTPGKLVPTAESSSDA